MSGKGNEAYEKFDREFGERNLDMIYGLMQPRRYCWPSLGEPCGNCHRCGPPKPRRAFPAWEEPEHELTDDYQRNDHD